RNPPLYRLERRRLARERQIISGSTALRRHPDDPSRRQSNRIRGPMHFRHPALHLLCPARYRTARRRLARPLGSRKHALGARRRVQGRPVALPRRPRRQEHGRRPSLLTRPHPRRQIQGKRQNPPKIGELESGFPPPNPANEMTVNLESVPCYCLERESLQIGLSSAGLDAVMLPFSLSSL